MSEGIIAETNKGPVKGACQKSCFDDEYLAFLGIPYATPISGQLRFRDPVEPEQWTVPLDATFEGPPAHNLDVFNPIEPAVVGADNCLHLNVFTKSLKPNSPRPVIAFIHGGAFMTGSNSIRLHGPDYFMRKDVVFVSINYRLGAFGFLSLKDPKLGIPGNAGLKDQSMALRWVKQNIANFGGNPNNITILGHSAGSAALHCHLISDKSKNLFNRAILMAGCAFNPWAIKQMPNYAYRLAVISGWRGGRDEAQVLEFLESTNPERIVRAQEALINQEDAKSGFVCGFGPIIEPYVSQNGGFLTEPILDLVRKAWSKDIDVIMGGCSDDGQLFCARPDVFSRMGDFEAVVPPDLHLEGAERKKAAEILRSFYFGNEEPSIEHLDKYLTVLTDKHFWHGYLRLARARLQHKGKGKTYFYRFAVESESNLLRQILRIPLDHGTCHGEDLIFMFKTMFTEEPEEDSLEYKTMVKLIGVLTKFAENGDPNDASIAPVKWEVLKGPLQPLKYLNMAEEWKMTPSIESERLKIWDSLYAQESLF